MKNLLIKRKDLILGFGILAVFVISYFYVPALFFQQDEILGFGIFHREGWLTILGGLWDRNIRHFVPLTMTLSYSIFKFFGLNYYFYNILALFFHLINGILIYFICRHYLKRRSSSFLAVLVFFSSNAAAQLIMWPVININSISLIFSLLAWLAILKKKLFWVPILFLSAVFSLEYSAGLILFIPLVVFLTIGKSLKERIIKLIPFGFTVLAYSLFRLLPILSQPNPALGVSSGNIFLFLANILKLIFRYCGQLFFGQDLLLFFSRLFQKVLGLSSLGTAYAEVGLFPLVSLFSGIVAIIFSTIIYQKIRRGRLLAHGLLLSFFFIIFSSLPFLLIPAGIGASSVISSRYMYFGLAGMALLVACIFEFFQNSRRKVAFYTVSLLVFLAITLGTFQNFRRAGVLYEQGQLRLKILNVIKSRYSSLPEKAVFYITSDMSYYGLPIEEKIPPFQSGFGQTLLLYYSRTENFPKDFFPGVYLWEITSQGYEEHEDRGFGYFRNIDLLKSAINKYNIPISSVIAFSWSGETDRLADITAEIREKIYK